MTASVRELRDIACPMADGTLLRTDLYLPEGAGPWPALLHRTPYGKQTALDGAEVSVRRLVAAGYLVAVQDVRGRHGSQGEFDPLGDEGADSAAAVAWLAAHEACSGRVGMFGGSYTAMVQWAALLAGAPALRAIAPAVSPAHSAYTGFRFRGGAREIGSNAGWSCFVAGDDLARRDAPRRAFEEAVLATAERMIDDESFFAAGSWARLPRGVPILDRVMDALAAPAGDPSLRAGMVGLDYDRIDVPVLLVGGWFDPFLGSTLAHHEALVARAAATDAPLPRLVIGPWSHTDFGGRHATADWSLDGSFRTIAARGDLTELHVEWFDAFLRDGPAPAGPPVVVYDTGASRWESLDSFPPPDVVDRSWFLGGEGGLCASPPPEATVAFVVDPFDPVPSVGGPTLIEATHPPGPEDQRPLYGRSDLVSFRGEPLGAALPVAGPVRAHITFSTTGDDADIVVRLCDEHPDGTSIVVADGIRRITADLDPDTGEGTRRAVPPGEIGTYAVDLFAACHTFRAGHRLRVDVAGASSPRWDVNRHVFAGPYDEVEPHTATHRVHLGGATASRIVLPARTALGDDPPHARRARGRRSPREEDSFREDPSA